MITDIKEILCYPCTPLGNHSFGYTSNHHLCLHHNFETRTLGKECM